MKKTIIFSVILLVIVGSGYYYFLQTKNLDNSSATNEESLISPARTAEINGYILSVQGNEVVIANEQGAKEISEEERARRQKLTQEERQALKAQESANLTKSNVTLIIPVGVTIVKGSGDASGKNVKAEMTELTTGIYVSVWKTGDSIDFVKLKGVATP